MRSRPQTIQAEPQNVCPLADSCTHLCRGTVPIACWIASMRAAMNPLHAVPENRLAIARPRFINGRCGSLLLQPRVISRRRYHGRRRGTRRQQRRPAAEAHKRSNGKTCVKSFHVVSPGLVTAPARTAVRSKFGLDRRHFKASARPCDLRPDLVRREPWRTLAPGLGALYQRDDAARQRHLQPVAVGDLGDEPLQIIDFGAPAALQILPH
jgi:hypothetical protein